MKPMHIGRFGWWLGAVSLVLGTAALAQAAAPSTQNAGESRQAASLLRDIRADATQIRSAAASLDTMTKGTTATWLDYDRQWNEIKPAQEDMQIKLARLESIQSSITPAERTEIDQNKQFVEDIQSRTAQLRALLDEPGVQTSDTKFRTYARALVNEATKLGKIS